MRVPFESLADYGSQAVGVTYTFDTPNTGLPDGLVVRFEGRRTGVTQPTTRDEFALERYVRPLPPGCGPVAVTLRALDVEVGEWDVRAEPQLNTEAAARIRVGDLPRAAGIGKSGFAPVIRVLAPGVILGAWPGLVSLGVLAGLLTQAALARHLGIPAGTTTLLLIAACLLGAVGAKAYFLLLHRDRQAKGLPQTGLAIQGFVLVAIATVAAGAGLLSIPLRPLLDTTAAGLMVGMAIGRCGCFFGGCCAGRPTASGWGRWSSDRSLGVRRIPTQLMESAWATVLALLAFGALWTEPGIPHGVVFVAALAAYTGGRQILFPLRDIPRTTATGRHWVLALCVLALVAAVGLAVAAMAS